MPIVKSICKLLIENLIFKFIIKTLVNSAAILAAAHFIQGITFEGDWISLIITGFALALANSIIKPILKFISGPIIALTMGLFMIIVNIIILWLVVWFMPELTITGFWAYFWGVVIISILNAITHAMTKKKA